MNNKERLNNQTKEDVITMNVSDNYWVELLDKIKRIRSSEKATYKKLLGLFATSADYDPKDENCSEFFRLIQNKVHYAAHGHTASEIIFERVDADKKNMGLTNFDGDKITLKDLSVAKNYLQVDEIKVLEHIVSGFFEFAKINAVEHKLMYMKDYSRQLDRIILASDRPLLDETDKVTRKEAMDKVEEEYTKYQFLNKNI